jgi:hypothetical protein
MQTNIHLWSYLAHFFLELEMFQANVVEKIKTRILCSVTFSEIRAVCVIMWKIWRSQTGHRWQYGACAVHSGKLRLRHTLKIWDTVLFHGNSGYSKAPQNYVIRTLGLFLFLNRDMTFRLTPLYKVPLTKDLSSYLKRWLAQCVFTTVLLHSVYLLQCCCTVCIYYSAVAQCVFTTVLLYSYFISPIRKWEQTRAEMRNAEQNFVITYLQYLLTCVRTYLGLVSYGSAIKDNMKGCIRVMKQGSP